MIRLFKKRAALFVALAVSVCATNAHAATLTFGFVGDGSPNSGAPGEGITTGTIVMDTDAATLTSKGRFTGTITDVDIVVNGVAVKSQGTPTQNTLDQTELGGRDLLFMTYAGAFAPTGAAYEVTNVKFDLRFNQATNIFDDANDLFSGLSGGEMFDLDNLTFAAVSINYTSGVSDITLINLARFDAITLNYEVAPVPLPAGLPLMAAGLGALVIMRRRQKT